MWCGFAPGTQLVAPRDKAYQLLAHGRWLSPGTPNSSTIKTGRHDIAEILLKVALNTINQIETIAIPHSLILIKKGIAATPCHKTEISKFCTTK